MQTFKKFPKIGQFRDFIRSISQETRYSGKDENGNPLYDNDTPLPVLNIIGTPKIHGTNAAVVLNGDGTIHFQKRGGIATPLKDNFGFASWGTKWEQLFRSLFDELYSIIKLKEDNYDKGDYQLPEGGTIAIYGEWAGEGIQKGVAVSQLPKSFYIFAVKINEGYEGGKSYWLDIRSMTIPETFHQANIYNVSDIATYTKKVDMSNAKVVINDLVGMTQEVEDMCPVGKYFDVEGVGEGIVWSAEFKGKRYWFKVKGDKHSVSGSSPKVLKPVDMEKLQSVQSLVGKLATVNRVKQAMFENSIDGKVEDLSKKDTPTILRWVANDIIEEEMDIILGAGFEWKDVAKEVSNATRVIFFKLIEL